MTRVRHVTVSGYDPFSMRTDTVVHAAALQYVYIASTKMELEHVANHGNAVLIHVNSSLATLYAKIPIWDTHYTKSQQ